MKKLLSLIMVFVFVMTFTTACTQTNNNGSSSNDASTTSVISDESTSVSISDNLQTIQLGTTEFTLTVSESFIVRDIQEAELLDGLVNSFYCDDSAFCIDVYQFDKSDFGFDTLQEFAESQMQEYSAEDLQSDELNNIPIYYYSNAYNNDASATTYVLENDGYYLEIYIYCENIPQLLQSQDIMSTLNKI